MRSVFAIEARAAAIVGIVALGSVACTRPETGTIPSDREIASLGADPLEARFVAIDARLRAAGLHPRATDERAQAGHAAMVAYRKTHDPRFERRARRWLGAAAADSAVAAAMCRASRDLAELELANGARDDAGTLVGRVLDEGSGDVACRDALRALGARLGLSNRSVVAGTPGRRGRVVGVEFLGDPSPDAAGVRVVVTLDTDARGEWIEPKDGPGARSARLRFDGVTFDASLPVPRAVGRGGLERITKDPATNDLVFELAEGANVRVAVLENPYRFVVDMDREPETPRDPARGLRLVVLDPGHGGDEHGARVDGNRESRLVLDIAKRAAASLATLLPSTRIVLTRTTDDEVSLEQRSALANALDADLFVSIHLNDADVPVATGGITTFVLDTEDRDQAVRLAARDHATTTDRVSGLSVLLAGLHRSSQVAESRRLASFVHADALAAARRTLPLLPDRGVRPANFYVLVGTRMPSILVECSFMTRPEELTALRTAVYRQSLGEGIARGIAAYAASR